MRYLAIVGVILASGSLAFAVGKQSSNATVRDFRSNLIEAQSRQMAARQSTSVGAGCVDGEAKPWFTVAHELPECFHPFNYSLITSVSVPDVNDDGTLDYIDANYPQELQDYTFVLDETGPLGDCLAFLTEVEGAGANCSLRRSCVANKEPVGLAVLAMYPTAMYAYVSTGFRDMDADQDMDMLLNVVVYLNDGDVRLRNIWLENTGFEHAPAPAAADINRDGRVDGADLGALLASWGPTP